MKKETVIVKDMTFVDVVLEDTSNVVFENVVFNGKLSTRSGSNITNCKFINCDIVKFHMPVDTNLKNCEFDGCSINSFEVDSIDNCTFNKCSMTIYTSTHILSINDSVFTSCTITYRGFTTKHILGCKYIECNVYNLKFLNGSYMIKTSFDICVFDNIISETNDCDIIDVSFVGCDIDLLILSRIRMIKTHFQDCHVVDKKRSKIFNVYLKYNNVMNSYHIENLIKINKHKGV